MRDSQEHKSAQSSSLPRRELEPEEDRVKALQHQVEVGRLARGVVDNPIFCRVMAATKESVRRAMAALDPRQTEEWAIYRAGELQLDALQHQFNGLVTAGDDALAELDGRIKPSGLGNLV